MRARDYGGAQSAPATGYTLDDAAFLLEHFAGANAHPEGGASPEAALAEIERVLLAEGLVVAVQLLGLVRGQLDYLVGSLDAEKARAHREERAAEEAQAVTTERLGEARREAAALRQQLAALVIGRSADDFAYTRAAAALAEATSPAENVHACAACVDKTRAPEARPTRFDAGNGVTVELIGEGWFVHRTGDPTTSPSGDMLTIDGTWAINLGDCHIAAHCFLDREEAFRALAVARG